MIPDHDDDLSLIISETSDEPENIGGGATHEVVAPGRSPLRLFGVGLVMAALGWLVISGGSTQETSRPPATTVPEPAPTPPPSTSSAPTPARAPRVAGALRDDRAFEVYESSPGVLCATIPDKPPATTSVDTCHLELESASGAGVIDELLVFGYLTAGAESASVRYRSGQPSNVGVRIEPAARFFALPLRADDAYRLQYRDSDYVVALEVPLVALRGGRSQSPEAAARDGVPDEIAALSFTQRLIIAAEWTTFAEGPVVWSRAPTLTATQPGWGEIVLLDPTGTRIERSTPVPSLRLTAQLSRPDALYFLGQQVATPDQMAVDREELRFPIAVVRIDRETGDHFVRLFPQASTNDEPDISPIIGRPRWDIGPELPTIDASSFGGIDDAIRLRATDGNSIQIDGTTLLPIG